MKYTCSFLLLLFSSLKGYCQNELKTWYFGTGTDGISFVNNVPQKLSNKLSGVGYEGMIVVNDPLTGELLFYSDGIWVVNKNHVIMPNGSGLTGHVSGAQCVQCCPVPGSCAKRFYLFTNSAYDNTQGKISYSIVDFTTDPLGTVTDKNTLFWNGPSDQGMCLVNKPNSNDYWLIANSFTTAAYNVWPLTSTGIGIPITYTFSNLGSSYVINYDKGTGKLTVGGGGGKVLTMLDFDANTGILSNEVQMAPGFYAAGASRFSPDGTKLYSGMSPTSSDRPRLYQYDFSTAAWTDMNSCCYAHDLKLGPDSKMYFIHTYNSNQPLGVIDFPNRTAVGNACNYHTLTFTPAFNGEVRRFPETVILPTPVTANSDSATLISNSITLPVLANDSASLNGVFFIDTIITPPLHGTAVISGNDIVYTAAQDICGITDTFTYRIKNQDCATDTAIVRVNFPACQPCTNAILSSDTTVCEGSQLTLIAQPAELGYSWTPSAGLSGTSVKNPTLTASQTETYYLTGKHLSGNLVVNGDFEQGNTAFSTGYTYSSPNPLAPPGNYTVAPSITNNWYANCADHTPTGANNMLLVDGANGTNGVPVGAMLWCQTVTVTPNTDYAFSTWLTNLNAGGATSQLRFSINGVQVGAVQNTPLGTCQWNRFYVLWNSGTTTTANICISEAGGAQPGNDLAIDDIFFGEVISCTDSITITVNPAERQNLQATICAGQQYILPSGITVNSTGIYTDTLHSVTGCDSIIATLDLTVSPQTIGFTAPDTVCLNAPVNIVNTSTCTSSYYWSFCSPDINSTPPDAINLGNPGNLLNGPTFSDYVKDGNGNYYLFVTNFSSGNLVRLDFGTTILSVPTAVNLGNFGGRLIPGGTEGIQVVNNENKWYAIITVGRINSPATAGLVKLEFGSSITNTSPSVTVWNNIGGLNYPCDITLFQQYGNWYGLVLNKSGNSISRFNFSNSFNNTPVGVNLGNVGNLNNPTGIYAIYDNGNWYAFITNSYQDDPSNPNFGTITRIDFGTSLLNTPAGINLGNPGGLLNNVRDIYIVKTCGNDIGFVVNWNSNDIVKLDFHNNITSMPTGTSLGNIGQMQTPHSISKFVRVGNDLYSFATNLGNSITRFRFGGCTGTNIPGSSAYTPPPVTYSSPGRYTINLVTDDSLPTQSSFCREIVVVGNDFVKTGSDASVCAGDSLQLNSTGAATYSWSPVNGLSDPGVAGPIAAPVNDVQYIVTGTSSTGCIAHDTINITIKPLPTVKINSDTVFCKGSPAPLNAVGAAVYSWTPVTGLSDPSAPNPVATPSTSYQYIVTGTAANGCSAKDTISLTMLPLPVITKTSDTGICKNTSVRLFAGGGKYYQWSSSSGIIADPLTATPMVKPVDSATYYYVTVTDTNTCVNNDSVKVSFRPGPVFTVSPGQLACMAQPARLNAGGGDIYSWSPAAFVNNAAAPDPLTDITGTTDFSVLITESTCHTDTTLFTTVTVLPPPLVTATKSNDIDCSNGSAKLLAAGGGTYTWSPATGLNDAAIANPVASPVNTQTYIVAGTNADGCTGYDTITIIANYIGTASGYYMPTAFTPNGDGRNDCYGIKYWGLIKQLQFYIYDRWGNIVFYTANPGSCWDGTYKGQPAAIGAYLYYIRATTTCGAVERKGTIVLSR